MKTLLFTAMVVLLSAFSADYNVCAAQNPYGEVNFVKIKPNMNESFLIDMKTSKRLANARKANKTINSWQLYRRTYPRGMNVDYDYATLSVFPSGVEMKAEGTWDSGVRELSVKEISDFLTSLGNVRTIVATDLYTYRMGVGTNIVPGEYVQLNLIKTKPGNDDAYEKLLESMKPVVEECIKNGELKGFNVWKRTYQTNVGHRRGFLPSGERRTDAFDHAPVHQHAARARPDALCVPTLPARHPARASAPARVLVGDLGHDDLPRVSGADHGGWRPRRLGRRCLGLPVDDRGLARVAPPRGRRDHGPRLVLLPRRAVGAAAVGTDRRSVVGRRRADGGRPARLRADLA